MATSTVDRPRAWDGQELSASCYIDGEWVQGADGAVADVLDPSTEQSLARLRFASLGQVQQAVDAARRAFDDGPWANYTPRERSVLLHRLTDLFESQREEFIDLIVSEIGSPLPLAQGGQVAAAIDTFRWFADAAARGPIAGGKLLVESPYGPARVPPS